MSRRIWPRGGYESGWCLTGEHGRCRMAHGAQAGACHCETCTAALNTAAAPPAHEPGAAAAPPRITYNERNAECGNPTHSGWEVVLWNSDNPHDCDVLAVCRDRRVAELLGRRRPGRANVPGGRVMSDHIVWRNGYTKNRDTPPERRRSTSPVRMSEKAFQAQVVDLMRLSGFRLVFHTYDSRRSAAGFPDLVAVRRPRVIFAELKVASNQPTPAQLDWLDELHQCDGVESYVWWPADLDNIRRILARDSRDELPGQVTG